MDNFIVHGPVELAQAWGSSPEAMSDDVFEHSACGVLLTANDSFVAASAAVGAERTKIHTLCFPFSMAEFEVLLRTVEQDAQGAMEWKEQRQLGWGQLKRPPSKVPQQRGRAKKTPLPREKSTNFGFADGYGGEDDMGFLWTIPDAVGVRTHVDLDVYEAALNELPK